MQDYTLQKLSQSLASKAFSAVELSQACLKKAHFAQGHLNAFIALDDALTLAQAQAADAQIADGTATPLTGIPIAHKDIFCAQGWRATAGSKMLANFVSPYDSHVVARFKAAGAVTLGKANCDEFAMGSSNENSAFGPVRNPWALDYVPGGSSGGSAAIVAAGIAPGATATDTGGSIRQPASFSGITGIKPTYGRVSRYGMIAFASSLDQGGAMAKTAEDCALMLNVMAGFDARDSTSLPRADEDFTRHLTTPLAGLRIGVPREYFAEGLSDSVAKPVLSAIDEFKKAGASVVEIGLPHLKLAVPVYYVIAPAEASSNLSRFDGVRYGHRAAEYKDLHDMYKKSRAEGFGAEVKRRILVGTYVLSHGYYDAYYLQAQKIRRLIAQDFTDAFTTCDVIMGPVAPTPAYRLGEKNDDPVAMYLGDLYTIPASLAGLPGMSIPCGFTADGSGAQLPIGLQLIGPYFDEAKLLGIAHRYQQVTDWHARVAPYARELAA